MSGIQPSSATGALPNLVVIGLYVMKWGAGMTRVPVEVPA